MNHDVQEAIKRSIMTEKNAMDFYLLCARQMDDAEARRIFELLAREEREHARQFYKLYAGDDLPELDILLGGAPDMHSTGISLLKKLIDDCFCEKKALELAMSREKELKNRLLELRACIDDVEVKAVFELNARETYNHYLMIEAEYARLMGMVDESDMDTYVRE
jgi:rubrerythrin